MVTVRKHDRVLLLGTLKATVSALPLVGPPLRRLKSTVYPKRSAAFKTSEQYREDLYASGRNSGAGSYYRSVRRKATVLNGFIKDQNLKTVLEWVAVDTANNSDRKFQCAAQLEEKRMQIPVSACRWIAAVADSVSSDQPAFRRMLPGPGPRAMVLNSSRLPTRGAARLLSAHQHECAVIGHVLAKMN
jgi:hypothetical protein